MNTKAINSGELDTTNLAHAYSDRGASYDGLSQYERAIEDYDEAIRLDPNDPLAYSNRGTTYDALGQYSRAIEDYDEAIRLNPNYAMAYYNRGAAYGDLGQYERAIENYDEAIRLNPYYAKAYNNRVIAYVNLDQYSRAIEDLDQLTQLDPNNAAAYNGKAWLLATAPSSDDRNGKEAIKSAENAVQLNDIASFHDTLAAAYAEAGQFSDAVREIERAIEMARAAGDTDNVAEYESRLNLYRQNEPYHEAPQ